MHSATWTARLARTCTYRSSPWHSPVGARPSCCGTKRQALSVLLRMLGLTSQESVAERGPEQNAERWQVVLSEDPLVRRLAVFSEQSLAESAAKYSQPESDTLRSIQQEKSITTQSPMRRAR